MGFVADIPGFLSTIDIFVLSSIHEGMGVAVIEAMAAGRTVIATQVGGLPELVENEVTGVLVPPQDSEALAQAISRLVSQETILEKMGGKAWERVQEHFTMEKMARRNEEYYYELSRDSSSRGLCLEEVIELGA